MSLTFMQAVERNTPHVSEPDDVQVSHKQTQNCSLSAAKVCCLPISTFPLTESYQTTRTGRIIRDRLQSADERSAKRAAAAESEYRLALAKRAALQREKQLMTFTEKRIAKHRAQRALKAPRRVREEQAGLDRILAEIYGSSPSSPKLAHDISFYENQTFEESRQYSHERLMEILGPERMQAPLLPSGHNPVDPVIDEYYRQVATNNILEQWEAQKAEMRQQAEEQQRLAAEEEVARFKTQVLLDHYRAIYIDRLERLALYGPHLDLGIDMLEEALHTNNMAKAAIVVRDLTHQILLPVHGLLLECDREIPLEEIGAEKLKSVWPVQRLEAMYTYLKGQPNLPCQIIDMLQGIETISKALANPTPFPDPFARKPVRVNAPVYANEASSNIPPLNNGPPEQGLPTEGFSTLGAASAPAGSGFSKLVAATAEKASEEQKTSFPPASSNFAQLLAAAAEKVKSAQHQSSTTPAPSCSPARTAVLDYIATDNMYFDTEIADLVKNNVVVGVHRRQATDCLTQLLDCARGEEAMLGPMDAGNYRTQIETCVAKINALPSSARLNRDTQALRKLCGRALKLWAVYA